MIDNNVKKQRSFIDRSIIRFRYSLKLFRDFIVAIRFVDWLYIVGWLLFIFFFLLLILVKNISNDVVNLFLFFYAAFILFSGCFIYEFSLMWKVKTGLLQPILSILATFSSFASIFLARCVVVYYTGVEPESISTASIIFSIGFAVLISILIGTVILLLFYAIIIFAGILFVPFSFVLTINFATLKSTRFWKFWFRSNIKESTKQNKPSWKTPIKFIRYASRVVGLALLGAAGLCFLLFTLNFVLLHEATIGNTTKEIIIYTSYRSSSFITECNNLNEGEWGLLLKNKKISVAKMQSFGGYSFTTKVCLLN